MHRLETGWGPSRERRPFFGASHSHSLLGNAKYETDKIRAFVQEFHQFVNKLTIEHLVKTKRHYFKHLTHMSA